MLPRPNKLTRSDDFRKAVKNGVRAGSHVLVVHAYDRSTDIAREGGPRTGLVVSKAVGNAVVRHRTSRRLRHVCMSLMRDGVNGKALPANVDIVIRALPASSEATSQRLERDIRKALSTWDI